FSRDGRTLLFESYAQDLSSRGFVPVNGIYALNLPSSAATDSDGDGMDDAWETNYFGTLARDGTGDFDGDGASDLFEFLTGTDPTDPASLFKGTIVFGQHPTINWPLKPGTSYRVQFKNDLGDAEWTDVTGSITFVGNQARITDLAPAPDRRFYRIVLTNP
ncbi:MAG TPA: hypothetical protein VN625_06490, partial [Desulfuromonadaceae bacterium]|nr:hypothetical protein [Desulfuromonadaceae bacterium]